MAKRWQKVELNYLKKHGDSKSLEDLAERFHTDVDTVEAKLRELRPEALGAVARAEEKALEEFEKGLEELYDERWEEALEILEPLAEEAQIPELSSRARQYADLARRRLEGEGSDDPYLEAVMAKNREAWDRALEICTRGGRSGKDGRFAYLAASIATKKGDVEEGARYLARAIELDSRNRAYARRDPDFADLREHDEHAELLAS